MFNFRNLFRKKQHLALPGQEDKKITRKNRTDNILVVIAVFLILSFVGFYLYTIQPFLLNRYNNNVINNLNTLQTAFADASNGIVGTQNEIITAGLYNPYQVCSTKQLYTKSLDNQNSLALLETKIANLNHLTKSPEVESVYGLYDENLDSIYLDAVSEYKNKVDKHNTVFATLKQLPEFYNYRNIWIKNCESLQVNKNDNTLNGKICTDTLRDIKNIKEQINDKDLSRILDDVITLCNSNSKSFATEYLAIYDELMLWNLDIESIQSALKSDYEEMTKMSQDSVDTASEYYENKSSLTKKLYFLSYK